MKSSSCKYTPPYELLYIYHITGTLDLTSISKPTSFVGQWIEAEDSFLFFESENLSTVTEWLSKNPSSLLEGFFEMSYTDWLGGHFSVFSAGLFTIIPAWENRKEFIEGSAYSVLVDPGVVFGAGTHATTQNALEALDLLYYLDTPQSVLDIGCGTGILGIAAVIRGALKATLVDNNPLCVQTADRNILLNDLSDKITSIADDAIRFASKPVDVMIANIHYDVLQHLITPEMLKTKKWLILSGILSSEVAPVTEALLKMPTEIIRHWNTDKVWHTFLVAVFPDLFE